MIDFKNIVVTLYEGSYHYGVAGFINSLKSAGFKGLVRVGYKGPLPPWIRQLKHLGDNLYELDDDIKVGFERLAPDMHFGYYKPSFIKDTFDKYSEAERVYYFDPDIVVIAPWDFYTKWVERGVALCLDNCFPYTHHNHPWREDWKKLLPGSPENKIDYYVNSGFVGLHRNDIALAERWISCTGKYRESGGDLSQFEKEGHRAFKGDQDLLNAVLTTSPDLKYSIIGTEGMGFTFPAYLMVHAVGNYKPWSTNFINHVVFNGIKPDTGARAFWKFYDCPIRPYSRGTLARKKLALKVASIIGRLTG